MIDLFESSVNPTGTMGVAFEASEDGAHLYLLDMQMPAEEQIVAAIPVHGNLRLKPGLNVKLVWNENGRFACLLLADEVRAAFDARFHSAFDGSDESFAKLSSEFRDAIISIRNQIETRLN